MGASERSVFVLAVLKMRELLLKVFDPLMGFLELSLGLFSVLVQIIVSLKKGFVLVLELKVLIFEFFVLVCDQLN